MEEFAGSQLAEIEYLCGLHIELEVCFDVLQEFASVGRVSRQPIKKLLAVLGNVNWKARQLHRHLARQFKNQVNKALCLLIPFELEEAAAVLEAEEE